MSKNVLDVLDHLSRIELSTIQACEKSLKYISDERIRCLVNDFRKIHVNNFYEISDLIDRYGGKPPYLKYSISGFITELLFMAKSLISDHSVLRAVNSYEGRVKNVYRGIMRSYMILPEDVLIVLKRCR